MKRMIIFFFALLLIISSILTVNIKAEGEDENTLDTNEQVTEVAKQEDNQEEITEDTKQVEETKNEEESLEENIVPEINNAIPPLTSNNTFTFKIYWGITNNELHLSSTPFEKGTMNPSGETDGEFEPTHLAPWNNYKSLFKKVIIENKITPKDLQFWFYFQSQITSIEGLNNLDTSQCSYMNYMFSNCISLTSLDLSSFDTSGVKKANLMFYNCSSLTSLDLSSFNTSNITSMQQMFSCCKNLKTIKVSDSFVIGNSTHTNYMFYGCTSLVGGNGTVFDENKVDKEYARYDNPSTTPGYFTKYNKLIFDPNGGSVDVICKDVKYNTQIGALPTPIKPVERDVTFEGWYDAKEGGNKITEESLMPNSETTIYAHWINNTFYWGIKTIEASPDKYELHLSGTPFTQTMVDSGITKGIFTDKEAQPWHKYKQAITKVIIDNPITPSVTDYWFTDLENTTSFEGLQNIYTSYVTSMSSMFSSCKAVTELDLSTFETSKVETMQSMFSSCSSLTYLDLSSFDTSNVTNMNGMFSDSTGITGNNLETIKVSDRFVTTKVTDSNQMFRNCHFLVGGNGTEYDANNVDVTYARYDNPDSSLPGYFTRYIKLKYDPNGGTVNVICKDIKEGMQYGTLPTPTKTGDQFAGWYDAREGGNIVTEENLMADHETTIYAHWLNSTIYWGLKSVDSQYELHLSSSPFIETMAYSGSTNGIFNYEDAQPWNSYKSSIVKVVIDNVIIPQKTAYWFSKLENVTTIEGISNINTEYVSTMIKMFSDCSSLSSLDISSFNTSNVKNMTRMFASCGSLTTLNLSNVDTSKVISMASMFYNCAKLTSLDISSFNTSTVNFMQDMFSCCSSLTEIKKSDNFITSNVTNMSGMFFSCSKLEEIDLSKFDTSNVTNMSEMFGNCSSLTSLKVASFNTSKVTNMSSMFRSCSKLQYIIYDLGFVTSNVTDMSYMFDGCSSLIALNMIMDFDTANVKNMKNMFTNCSLLEVLHVSTFNTTKVIDMSYMFSGCSALTELDVSKFNTSSAINMKSMFNNCSLLETLDLSKFDTSLVIDMSSMFKSCAKLNTLTFDKTKFITTNVIDMSNMFDGCSSLTKLDVANFATSKVTDMSYMFKSCSKITTLDLSKFNTEKVRYTDEMFNGCSSLETIKVTNFVTNSISSSSDMFKDCNKLVGGNGTIYDSNKVDITYARIDNPNTSPGYFTRYNKLIFNPNEGTVDRICKDVEKNTKYGTLPTPRRTDYIFVGWYDKLDGGNRVNENTLMDDHETTIYAKWQSALEENIYWGLKEVATSPITYELHLSDREITEATIKGVTSGVFSYDGQPWHEYKSSITNVVIDYPIVPKQTACWFYGLENVTTINNLTNIDTKDVTDMSMMFGACSSLLTLDVSSLNTTNVTDMSAMFVGCSKLKSLSLFTNTQNVTNMSFMFGECQALTNLDVSKLNTTSVTNMSGMFYTCSSLTALDVSTFDTSKVNDISSMFSKCSSLTDIDVSSLNTVNVTDMSYLFSDCTSLTSIKLASTPLKFVTTNVEDMSGVFGGCLNLSTLDLSTFDTTKVTDMSRMFNACSKIETIKIYDSFNTNNVIESNNMFSGCTKLVGGNGTSFDSNIIDKTYARYDNPDSSSPGYFTKYLKLKFDFNGISFPTGTRTCKDVENGKEYGKLPTTTKKGYTLSWNTKDDGTGDTVTDKTIMGDKETTIFAKLSVNTYTITYHLDGGELPTGKTNPTSYNIETETITLNNPTKTGYTFEGFYDNPVFIGNPITTIPKGSTGNKDLYVKWNPITYTIAYHLDGGELPTGKSNPTSYNIETETITLNNPTKTGYTFEGFYDNPEFTGSTITTIPKGSYGNKNIYAKFTANTDTPYVIKHLIEKLDGNYELKDTDNLKGTSDAKVTPSTKSYEGFTAPSSKEITIAPDGTTELEYKYTRNSYDLTITKGKGIDTCSTSNTYKYEQQVNLSATLKTGYENITYSGDVTTSSFTMPAKDIDVTISASPITYTITYHLDGGVETTNPTSYNIETDTITLNNPTKTNYSFIAFYDNDQFEGTPVTTIPKGTTDDKELYAKYEKNTFTYTISDSVNTTYDGKDHTIEVKVTKTTTPVTVKVSYSLDGGTNWVEASKYTSKDVTNTNIIFKLEATNYETVTTGSKSLIITKRPITIKSKNAAKQYDGTPLTCHEVEITSGSYAKDECFTYNFTGSQTDTGMTDNLFTCEDKGSTKKSNYDITIQYGTLSVNPKIITEKTNPTFTGVTGKISYTKDKTNNCVITIDKEYSKFIMLNSYIKDNDTQKYLNNVTDYTVTEGSTKITLFDSYIKKLSVGTHSFEIRTDFGTGAAYYYYLIITINPEPTPTPPYVPVDTSTK